MSVIVALFLDYQFGTAIFQLSNTKRQVTLFLYIGPHPFYRPAHRQDFGMGTIAKVQKVSEIHKESGKFFKVQIRICYNSNKPILRLKSIGFQNITLLSSPCSGITHILHIRSILLHEIPQGYSCLTLPYCVIRQGCWATSPQAQDPCVSPRQEPVPNV